MVGGVQQGILAACIVLFLQWGWWGGTSAETKCSSSAEALFITLAVGVHLMPYFQVFPIFFLHLRHLLA